MKAFLSLVLGGAVCFAPAQNALDDKVEPLMIRLRAAITNFDLVMAQISSEKQAQNTYKQYLTTLRTIADDAGMLESQAKDKGTKCRFGLVYYQAMANYLTDSAQADKIAESLVTKYRDVDALCVPIEHCLFLRYMGQARYAKMEKELLKSKNAELLGSVALMHELVAFMDEKGDLNRLRQISVTHAKSRAGARAKRVFDLRTKLVLSRPMPSYVLDFGDGKKVDLATLKGKITVIHFWGFWSGEELSSYRDLILKNSGRVQILGINTDTWNPAYLGARIKDRQIWWPNVLAGSLTGTVPVDFGLLTYPSTIIIDAEGIVRALPGVGNWRETLDKLLEN